MSMLGPWSSGLAALAVAWASAVSAADRPTHHFLEVALSPDGGHIASVEGDRSSAGALLARALVIRGADGASAVRVALPCGNAAECSPASLAWTPDGARLAFALRTPGTHARSIYSVRSDGAELTRLIQFDGTIEDLRYGRDGQLSMLATAGATKEVGATQAGAPITGDLGGPTPEQRIAVLAGERLEFVSPPDLFVYEYDRAPDGTFVGTASPGDGDNNWWTAKLYRFSSRGARVLYAPPTAQGQIADPRVSPDGRAVAFISGIMSDFGSTGGDIFIAPIAGGAARNITPGVAASATSLTWGCDGALIAERLAGE
ncbi:MAG TPA: S9 family peptidase, partial [Caulobacteraceae bacterium]